MSIITVCLRAGLRRSLLLCCLLMLSVLWIQCHIECVHASGADSQSGQCGAQVYYSFDADSGSLSVTGSGDMWDFTGGVDISSGATSPFRGSEEIRMVTFGEGITSIGAYAFENCSQLEQVRFPDTLVAIHDGAFLRCSRLRDITLPGSLLRLGKETFAVTQLTQISLPAQLAIIPEECFSCCFRLTDVTLPKRLKKIQDGAFESCRQLWNLHLPDSLTFIGKGAFWGCASLQSVEIPSGVAVIPSSGFGDCPALCSIRLPEKLKRYDRGAFWGCTALKTVQFQGTRTQWQRLVSRSDVRENSLFQKAEIKYGRKLPGRPQITQCKAKKKALCVRWRHGSGTYHGYQICIARDAKFHQQKQSIFVKNKKAIQYTAYGLKSGKRYYVKIRSYRNIHGQKDYSSWSKTKKMIIK